MTLNELRVACVKKTVMDDTDGFSAETYDEYKNKPDYAEYCNNVDGCINSAIQHLSLLDKIKWQSFTISLGSTAIKKIMKSDHADEFSNVYRIKGGFITTDDGNSFSASPTDYGTYIELPYAYKNATLTIYYSPKMTFISGDVAGTTDISTLYIDDLAANFIIFFSKGELYEKIEPDLSEAWKSRATSYLTAMTQDLAMPQQKSVIRVIHL